MLRCKERRDKDFQGLMHDIVSKAYQKDTPHSPMSLDNPLDALIAWHKQLFNDATIDWSQLDYGKQHDHPRSKAWHRLNNLIQKRLAR